MLEWKNRKNVEKILKNIEKVLKKNRKNTLSILDMQKTYKKQVFACELLQIYI